MGTAYWISGDDVTATKINRTMTSGTTASPGSTTFVWYGRVRYNGASWEVSTSAGSAGIETSMLSWDGTDDELDIDFTKSLDFAEAPVLMATPLNTDAAHFVKTGVTESAGEFTGHIAFFDTGNGARETSESTAMDVSLIVIGKYT